MGAFSPYPFLSDQNDMEYGEGVEYLTWSMHSALLPFLSMADIKPLIKLSVFKGVMEILTLFLYTVCCRWVLTEGARSRYYMML